MSNDDRRMRWPDGHRLTVRKVWIGCLLLTLVFGGARAAQGQLSTGACCLPDDSCTVTTRSECLFQLGGSFVGTPTCAADTCTGACCLPDGKCTVATRLNCTSAAGVFAGIGSPCAKVDCAGACCAETGECVEAGKVGCQMTHAGEFLGLEATCVGAVCTGACCLPDKSCADMGPAPCAQSNGSYQGRETVCGDDCPVRMPASFTYQGQLKRGGVPMNGLIDARFSLWLSPTGQDPPNQVGSTLPANAIEVVNGLFSVALDFGQNAFNGNARWLQVEIHDHADPAGMFTTLAPRQLLTPTPYALQTRGIVVTDNGNVGIGTKYPINRLTVAGDADFSGNVGIGTTGPTSGLHIKKEAIPPGGTLALEGATHTYMSFFPDGAAAGRKGYFGFAFASATDLTIANEYPGGRFVLATPSRQVFATGGEENLRIVRGYVNANGTPGVGAGFSVVRTGEGRYTITFNTPFAGPPVFTASLDNQGGATTATEILFEAVTSSSINLVMHTNYFECNSCNPLDSPFGFIAIGPR